MSEPVERSRSPRRVAPRRAADVEYTQHQRSLLMRAIAAWAVVATCGLLASIGLQVKSDRATSSANHAAGLAETAASKAEAALAKANLNYKLLTQSQLAGCVRSNEKIRQDDLNDEAVYSLLNALPQQVVTTDPGVRLARRTLSWIATTNCSEQIPRTHGKYSYARPVPFSVRSPSAKDLEVGDA